MIAHSDMVVDLFAGPGGWSVAAQALGMDEVGYEWDGDACATARAAGHRRVQVDIATVDLSQANCTIEGLIASPPCQGFSPAGKGQGRKDTELLLKAIPHLTAETFDDALAWLSGHMKDDRSLLALQPLRWALELRPRWIAWEQVTPVLPLWDACAEVLRAAGYSVATGILHAEQFGVPQTRKRAILVARRDGKEARLPTPTHSRYYPRDPQRLDPGVKPWVSMADALGTMAAMRSNYGTGGDPKARGVREPSEPSFAVTGKIGRNKWVLRSPQSVAGGPRASREDWQPALTVTGNWGGRARWQPVAAVEGDTSWVHRRPSPTIVGSFAPDVVAAPGYRKPGDPPRQRTPGSVRVTVQEAAILQSFPPDHPWQGSPSAQYQQVGNAIPVFLAWHILREISS